VYEKLLHTDFHYLIGTGELIMRLGQSRQDRIFGRHDRTRGALSVFVVTWLACVAPGQEFVPFVIPARLDPQQPIWMADAKPIRTDARRLKAAEHFSRDDGAVRIWGVNLCFGANFPTHEDAPHVAQRLAAAGVNSVRCHHLDTSRWPQGIWNSQDGKTIEPQALDRLDYFINELARRGIYVNINLHVGRDHSRYLGLPRTNREYDKISGIFAPALIDAQKQYARDLLTHVNPYRGVRWANDPAIAFVEITNEDSFFMWGAEETLRTLPPYYADILRRRFNSWLDHRYGSDDALRAAWSQGTQSLGKDVLQNGTFTGWDANQPLPQQWSLEQHENCRASLSRPPGLPGGSVQVEINRADTTEWHLQLTQGGFPVAEGRYYTVSFAASSPQPRAISCSVSQAHSPWANLGLSQRVELGPEGKKFRFGFVATANDDNARISFAFGADATTFKLGEVELRPGGQVAVAEGESLRAGSVSLFQESESTPRILDRLIFLAETEKAYFDGMRSFIKNDLGCDALVTGTIIFGPLGLYAQSDMDYIDAHAYWQHPSFPGRPWDQANWLIQQSPMTDHPEAATLFNLAAERLLGKPFTVSEYNHPAPLDAQAECVPMIASFAAAQDWDGLWLFTYSHAANDWGRETMSGFFDMDTNPGKWGFMRAGTAIFRDRCISPLNDFLSYSLADGDNVVAQLATLHRRHDGNMFRASGISRDALLKGQHVSGLGKVGGRRNLTGPGTEIAWTVKNGNGMYAVQSWGGSVYVGHSTRFQEATDKKITIVQPPFVALTITGLGGEERIPLEEGDRILITACGRCENTDMQFSPDRRTVGRNWGHAPVRIEAVRGSVVVPDGRWTCHALAPDGSPRQQVPIAYEDGRGTLTLSPEYGTMWYLLERQTK